MNKTLFVPDHVKKNIQKDKKGKIEQAYVKANERFLEPSKLESSVLDKLPTPTGWRILILPYQGQKQTTGGIMLPDEVREREALATVCGYVLKIGPLAFKDESKFGDTGAWCKEKDWVLFGRYAGSRFKIEGGEVRILNDDEIIARISNPEDILHV